MMKIFVLFVEPMLYGMDLIYEVYEKTDYVYRYVYCNSRLTGKDDICLPNNAFVCSGTDKDHQNQIISILADFKPDFAVINGYVGKEQTVAIKYCQKNRIPYAIESDTPLHVPENKLKAIVKKIYLRKILHHPYCYGFPGGTLQKENFVYYGIPEEKNYIMPMSVSSERIEKEKEKLPSQYELKKKYGFEGKKVFLFIGRLEKVKNVDLLIRAFEKLKQKEQNLVLLIVGDGSEMSALKKLVETRHISDVCFVGYIVFPHIVKFYKMADVFVLPSSYEPWGLVINEAMIMELPVVISSVVGCRADLVTNGKNGFVFKNNNKDELEVALKNALDLKIKYNIIDDWNYAQYLKKFRNAVKNICKK